MTEHHAHGENGEIRECCRNALEDLFGVCNEVVENDISIAELAAAYRAYGVSKNPWFEIVLAMASNAVMVSREEE